MRRQGWKSFVRPSQFKVTAGHRPALHPKARRRFWVKCSLPLKAFHRVPPAEWVELLEVRLLANICRSLSLQRPKRACRALLRTINPDASIWYVAFCIFLDASQIRTALQVLMMSLSGGRTLQIKDCYMNEPDNRHPIQKLMDNP